MMYQDRLAVAIKVNGKVLREFGDTVYIPFASEYSIYVKNLNSLRAMVRLRVDGQDATEGVSLVVQPNDSLEVERFIKGGNIEKGNRFKFIERTAKVEEHRGIQAEDGLIRVEFEFEREPALIKNWEWEKTPPYNPWIWPRTGDKLYYGDGPTYTSGTLRSRGTSMNVSSAGTQSASTFTNASNYSSVTGATMDSSPVNASLNDAGITVPGSVSDQSFKWTSGFLTDGVKHVMVLKLLGEVGQKPVKKAVTVKTTQKCTTCGHLNKATAKFCAECGTGLVLV